MQPEPLVGVTITAREIYDAVVRLSGGVEVIVAQQAQTKSEVEDHETRIRALERARWPLPSIAVLLSVGATVLALLQFLK